MGDERTPDGGRNTSRHLIWVVALIVGFWAESSRTGLGMGDFAGHVGLLSTLWDQVASERALPLWTSDWYSGASMLLTYLHPLFSLAALAPFAAAFGPIEGLRIGATFYLVLSGISMFAFCRAFGGSSRGAAIGALIYALHPSVFVFVGGSGQIHQPVTMAIIPLVLLAWLRLAEQATPFRVVAAAVVSALLFYDMQRFWMVFPFALVVYATAIPTPREAATIRNAGFALIAVAAVMTGLLFFPAVPGFAERELLQWHHPASLELYRERNSIPGMSSLVDRDGVLARGLEGLAPVRFASLPGQWYQGLVALCFVGLGGLLSTRDGSDRVARGRLALALGLWMVALWLAFGVHAIGPLLAEALSELARIGPSGLGLAGWLGHGVLGLIALAWLGSILFVVRAAALDRWRHLRWQLNVATAVGVVALLTLTPFEWLARWVFVYGHIRAPGHFGFPLLGFWLGAAAAVATPLWDRLLATRPRQISFAIVLVVLLVADVSPYRERLGKNDSADVIAHGREALRSLRGESPGRLLDTRQYNPLANMLGAVETDRGLAWGWLGWSSTRFASDVIAEGFYGALRQAVEDPPAMARSMETAAALAGLANVRFVTSIGSISPPLPASNAFAARWNTDAIQIHENLRTLPYAHFYSKLALVSGSPREVLPVLARLSQRGVTSATLTEPLSPVPDAAQIDYWFGDRAGSLAPQSARPALEALSEPLGAGPESASSSEPCSVTRHQSRRITLSCAVDQVGYLVIAESWSPAWSVVVDGTPRNLLRLNHAFQGVRVAPGDREVVFIHRVSSVVTASLWISGASWLGVTGFAGWTAAVAMVARHRSRS